VGILIPGIAGAILAVWRPEHRAILVVAASLTPLQPSYHSSAARCCYTCRRWPLALVCDAGQGNSGNITEPTRTSELPFSHQS
jgi:hypothetical protein